MNVFRDAVALAALCFSTRRALALLLALLAAPAVAAVDEDDLLPIDEAYVLTAIAPTRDRIEFTWTVAEGYYLYRHRMGAEALDGSFEAGALELPPGEKKTDEFFGDVETYRNSVTGTLVGVAPPGAATATFKVKYQGCADLGICYPPHSKTLTVELPQDATSALASAMKSTPAGTPLALGLQVGGALAPQSSATPIASGMGAADALPLPEDEAFQFEAIATSPVELLLRLTPAPGYYLYRDKITLTLLDADGVALATPAWPAGEAHADEHFGEVRVYFDQVEVPMALRRSVGEPGEITLEATFQGCQTDGICYPPMTRRIAVELPAATPDQLVTSAELRDNAPQQAGIATTSLLAALLLALGGGLILNLMPCVLPVLSLKALSLAQSGESRGMARSHALWYTLGVLASFAALGALALALRQAGLALGWGFQLQQPLVVGALAYLMAAIGLSLSGVFSIGGGFAGVGQSLTERSGPAGDFFTGVLAVVVASPCTAPFMGTALAFAFASGPVVALLVFLALGLGLALPFLLIGFVPGLASRLPKPGAWMETFKQLLAFPMYLTAAWLLWVLGNQRGVDAIGWVLGGLVLLALALWWWERSRWAGRTLQRVLAVLLGVAALWPLWQAHRLAAPSAAVVADGTETYSAIRLETLRTEGRTVFVNMTADWCVTCKLNEKRVLDTDTFRAAMSAHDALYMKGDWTDVDPEITRFLDAHGSVGVPLYVVFVPGQDEGIVLPTLLSQGAIDDALDGTF